LECISKKRDDEARAQIKKGTSATAQYAQVEIADNIADATAMACCTILKGARNHANSKAWHIDSGASDHISNLKSNFVNLKRLDIPIRI